MQESHNYLLECFKGSYDELKFRVRHRDGWLKTHLLAQLAILALASGVELKVVSSAQALPTILSLALPTSLVVLIFYLIEENTVSSLSRYISGLSKIEASLTDGKVIQNFDSSEVVTVFFKHTLRLRVLGQVFAFLVIPSLICIAPFRELADLNIIEIVIDILSGFVIVFLIVQSYTNRQYDVDSRVSSIIE